MSVIVKVAKKIHQKTDKVGDFIIDRGKQKALALDVAQILEKKSGKDWETRFVLNKMLCVFVECKTMKKNLSVFESIIMCDKKQCFCKITQRKTVKHKHKHEPIND